MGPSRRLLGRGWVDELRSYHRLACLTGGVALGLLITGLKAGRPWRAAAGAPFARVGERTITPDDDAR